MTGWADLERLFRPATTQVVLQLDGTAAAQEAQLRRRVAALRAEAAQRAGQEGEDRWADLSVTDPVAEAEADLAAHREQARATEVTFHLQAISYAALEELKLACPPGKAEAEQGLLFSEAAFAPRLVAACLQDPRLTDAEAEQLFARFTAGQVNTLFRAAWQLCTTTGQVAVPLSETASAPTPDSVPS